MSGTISRRRFLQNASLATGGLMAAGGISAFLAACQTASQTGGEAVFRVGMVTSLSGADAFGGNLTRRAYDFWAETINAKGGVEAAGQKYKVKMFYADDQSEPATGADGAERMIVQDHVEVILGPYTSGVQLAVDPICSKYKVPLLGGSAESPKVWLAKPKYSYGIIPAVDLTADKSLAVLDQPGRPQADDCGGSGR